MKKSVVNFTSTIVAVLIGSFISFITQKSVIKDEKKYSFTIEMIKAKTELYEETVDVYQELLNPLPKDSVSINEVNMFTNKFANIMNRNILYFDKKIGDRIEHTIKTGYDNISSDDAAEIMNKMIKEIKNDREKINL